VQALAFSADGRRLAVAGSGGLVRLRDVDGERPSVALGHPGAVNVNFLGFSRDGRSLAAAGSEQVLVWDVAARAVRFGPRACPGGVAALAFAPDGQGIALGGGDGAVRLWDAATGAEKAALRGHAHPVTVLAFAASGRWLASGTVGGGEVRLWDLSARGERAVLDRPGKAGGRLWGAGLSDDGGTLATLHVAGPAGEHGVPAVLRWWDPASGQEHSRPAPVAFGTVSPPLALTADGRTGAAVNRGEMDVHVWDTGSSQERAVLRGHLHPVCCLAFAPDGRTLASGDDDGTVFLWGGP
jgi:WD40 repeat protein